MKLELNKKYYIAKGNKVGTLVIDSAGVGTVFYREVFGGKESLVKSCPIDEFRGKLERWVQCNATWYGDKMFTDHRKMSEASLSFGVPLESLTVRLTKAPSSKANHGGYKHMVLVPDLHKG